MYPMTIECSNHTFAPYSFVCKHLVANPNQLWVGMEIEDGRETENDWLCETCAKIFTDGEYLEETLVPICMHCVRELRNET